MINKITQSDIIKLWKRGEKDAYKFKLKYLGFTILLYVNFMLKHMDKIVNCI